MILLLLLLPLFIMEHLAYVFIPAGAEPEPAVASALAPFDAALEVAPYPVYLPADEIAAMARFCGVRRNQLAMLATMMPLWAGCPGGVDVCGLHFLSRTNPAARWKSYEFGGHYFDAFPDMQTPASVLLKSKILRRFPPHHYLTPDGVWHSLDLFVHEPEPFGRTIRTPDRLWMKGLLSALRLHAECDIAAVDLRP